MNEIKKEDFVSLQKILWSAIGVLAALILLSFVSCAGSREYSRWQKRADANNRVKITHIEISRAQQQAKINRAQIEATKAEAQKRIAEAHGIREAQDLISRTLTPLYVQHEAIQAQKLMGGSPNHTQVYIPVGPQGIPIVKTTP